MGQSKNWSKALQQVTLLQVIFPPVTSSVPALILPTPNGPVLSDPTSDSSPPSPAQIQCDVDPVSALVHFCSTPSPVPSLSPAPTLDATASPALQESVVAETVERLSAVAQQKGLAFDVSTLPQFVQDASVRIQLTFFVLSFFSSNQLFSEPLLYKRFHMDTHTNMGLNWGSTSYK